MQSCTKPMRYPCPQNIIAFPPLPHLRLLSSPSCRDRSRLWYLSILTSHWPTQRRIWEQHTYMIAQLLTLLQTCWASNIFLLNCMQVWNTHIYGNFNWLTDYLLRLHTVMEPWKMTQNWDITTVIAQFRVVFHESKKWKGSLQNLLTWHRCDMVSLLWTLAGQLQNCNHSAAIQPFDRLD